MTKSNKPELKTTPYYEECLRFFKMAKWLEDNCNIGNRHHSELPYDDDMMKIVTMYDAVQRKHASWMSLLYDVCWPEEKHPWYGKLDDNQQKIIRSFVGTREHWTIKEVLFVFFIHRLTGSAMDYSLAKYGYGNSVLPYLNGCKNINEMIEKFKKYPNPKYTSKGYQIAAFPKIPLEMQSEYRLAGDHFICEIVPKLIDDLVDHINTRKSPFIFRDLTQWLLDWNVKHGYRRFKFQYNCVVGDIAIFYPDIVDNDSMCELGPNAAEGVPLLIDFPNRCSKKDKEYLIEQMVYQLCEDTGLYPYDVEDTVCVFIHWLENHIDTSKIGQYTNIDLDKVFGSHRIIDHPKGRQKIMLDMGLVDSFNSCGYIPTDTRVIDTIGMTQSEYKNKVKEYLEQ